MISGKAAVINRYGRRKADAGLAWTDADNPCVTCLEWSLYHW